MLATLAAIRSTSDSGKALAPIMLGWAPGAGFWTV